MNISTLNKKFNTKAKCIKHLEIHRWGRKPVCPHCDSYKVSKKRSRKYFYRCRSCKKDFTVLFGTIFEASKLELPKWFQLIGLMLNARKGISAKQIQRDIGLTYKTAWYSAMRVRCAMVDEIGLLEGIVEMDEAYVGGKPRKRNAKVNDSTAFISNIEPTKRGRGTKKIPIIGIVEREGKKRVITEVAGGRLTTKNMLAMLHKYVNLEKSIMMTDEARFYNKFEEVIQHLVIKHKESYAQGIIHTNTIEGFWSIIKNGIRGQYHVLSKKYLPFYLAEFSYKYNRRNDQEGAFDETIQNAVDDDKCLTDYKPKGNVRKIAYGKDIWKKNTKKPKHRRVGRPRKKKSKPIKKKKKKKATRK